ncbi:glycosyl hydrolase family 76-domain-containing protein [Scheffersomyces amazonensis]|uniref:glycosyl hydrolase family 76-domain-containing protein n=1 Tax=Scheffersomyces amazonensis TaxID=1078765 RepID=UPI00315D23AC
MIDGYTATGNLEYLYSAQEIVDFLISQWNPSTGGVIWSYKQNYVASISTTESALAAMRLYSITQNSTLLNFAEDCMNFMFQYLQDPNDKLFYDGLDANDITNVNTGKLTYTVGTGISALSYMYKYTQNSTYLNQAISLGQAALEDSAFIDGIGMLNNKLEYVHLLFAGYADLFNNVQWQNEFEDLKTKILKQGNYIYNFLQDPDDSYLYYDSATGGTQKMFNDYEDVYPDNQVFTLDDSIYCNNDPNAATIKNLMDNASAAQILYELSRI